MTTTAARFLMCRPDHFAVAYAINPWMNPESWASESNILVDASRREWAALHRALAVIGAAIELLPPVPHLPDLVFTANAAVVLDRRAVLSRFRYPERSGEEEPFASGFRALQRRVPPVERLRRIHDARDDPHPGLALPRRVVVLLHRADDPPRLGRVPRPAAGAGDRPRVPHRAREGDGLL